MEKEQYNHAAKFNLQGFEYYIGGVFEFLSLRTYSITSPDFVNQFDWRSRHGANNPSSFYFGGEPSPYYDGDSTGTGWLTAANKQPCAVCWAFASVGAVEGLVNLFFNEHYGASQPSYHHIDLNLSEWNVIRCLNHSCEFNPQGNPRDALDYIQDSGVVDSVCMPLDQATGCGAKCDTPAEVIRISGNDTILIRKASPNNEDWLRKCLIVYGPLACSIDNWGGMGTPHVMALVGYKALYENDVVYVNPQDPSDIIAIEKGSPLIGSSTWIFKNSDGPTVGDHGFTNLVIPYDQFSIDAVMNRKILGDIIRNGHTNAEIRCVDEDGDGYYWWGIHTDSLGNPVNPQLCNCPDSVINPDLEDCDDSDPDVGPYNLVAENGPLYECLPDCNDFSDDPYLITQDDSIKRNRHFNRNLIVNPGATLKIKNCTISFSGQAKLLVKRGAKLVIENATLTTHCPETVWQGVEVWGNSEYSQTDPEHPQGEVDIVSGTIEKARIGITTVNYEFVPERDTVLPMQTYSGGIIKADYTTFRDNIVAVEFYPYGFTNTGYLRNCSFESTIAFPESYQPDYFIKMLGVDSVEISSCSFINTRNTNSFYWSQWGGGIFSYNSSVLVKRLGSQAERCRFQKLTRGIYALNSGDTKSVTIEDTEFTEIYRAIYLSGMGSVNTTRIVLNDIEVQVPPANVEQYPYGLYLDNCTGYKVEANTFNSDSRDRETIGLIVNNSGPEDNIIYRNTFKKLYAGIIAQNRNRNYNGSSGLEMKCNIFSGLLPNSSNQCVYDISVTTSEGTGSEIGIRQNQGTYEAGPDKPAGNVFSNDSIPESQWQYLNYGNFVNYWHHSSTESGEIIIPTRFNVEDPPVFDTTENPGGYMYIYTYCCPSTLNDDFENPDSLRDELIASESDLDSVELILSGLIDGGSTEVLYNSVVTAWPEDSIPLRNDLLTEAPYLSDSVMISSIQKEDVLSSEMITEILSANPHAPKSNQVMDELNSRSDQLTDEQWFTVLDGLDMIGEKEMLEMELSAHISHHADCLRKLIKHFKITFPQQQASDSIVDLLYIHGNLSSYYEIINEYLSRRDTINALTIYYEIPNQFSLTQRETEEYEAFGEYLLIRISMVREGIVLSPDSVSKFALYSLFGDNSSLASVYARTMLITTDTLLYSEPVILPCPELKQISRIRIKKAAKDKEANFTLFPNPASSYLIAQFNEFSRTNDQFIELIDVQGKNVKRIAIPEGTLYYFIDISDLSSGCYLGILHRDSKQGDPVRFCIVR